MFSPRFQGVLAAVLAGFALSATADTLLVVGAIPVSSGDAQVVSELQALGQPVTVIQAASSTAASANGMALVIISNSVAPGKVGNKFNQVTAPVIAFEPGVYDNLGMTGALSGTDFGRSSNNTQLRISGTHPLTAGLSGLVTVGTSPAKFSWGKPGASAVIAATLKGNLSRPTIFGYEAGASLANGTSAPARRIAIHLNDGATDAWNANGRALFGAAVNWALGNGPTVTVTRILPLGDSITKGKTGHWSYRRDLEAAMQGADCLFDFIGKQSGPSSGPGTALVDRNHEGHSGFRSDEILSNLTGWLNGIVPHWALVHVGTNDVLQGTSIAAARANVSGIIDKLRNANPSVGILLAQVIPNLPGNESAVVALNDELASLAAQKNSQASPVILVDHYSGYSTFTHNYDQIHPNDAGEGIMAQRWFEALYPRIAGSCGH